MHPNGSNNSLANIQGPGTQFSWTHVVVALVLSFTIIGTIIGNSLVCIAVLFVKKLQTPSNFLIVSLAVSDLFVALFVMPLALLYELTKQWQLGDELCDAWTSLDVMLCTASILNLCMISVDRYCVITRPLTYAMKRNPTLIAWLITIVWLLSALISIPPLFGWKTVRKPLECGYSQELGYQIYATVGAFYLPCTIMIIVYYRIWKVSTRISRAEIQSQIGSIEPPAPYSNRPKSSTGSCDTHLFPNGSVHSGKDEDNEIMAQHNQQRRFTIRTLLVRKNKSTPSKESKATKTLGVIMGGFIACWLPFFILALVNPVCNTLNLTCPIHQVVYSIFLWLGYFNSFMNPLIYARFNQEFRRPFREILCCRCRGMNMRLRTESYAAQFGPDQNINASNRNSLRITANDTTARYHSQGHTLIQLGNGSTASEGESKL